MKGAYDPNTRNMVTITIGLLAARCGMNHSHHFDRHIGWSPQILKQVPL
jgi:hypothetical protein